jgi:hypothetical protein
MSGAEWMDGIALFRSTQVVTKYCFKNTWYVRRDEWRGFLGGERGERVV